MGARSMSFKILAAAPFMLLVAGCGDAAEDETATEAASEATDTAGASESGFTAAVDCHAKLVAVARLWNTLADNSTGAEQQEMRDTASSRDAAAVLYRSQADTMATELGKTPEQVEEAVTAATAAVDAEFEARAFEDFAVWLGGEADKCPPPTT